MLKIKESIACRIRTISDVVAGDCVANGVFCDAVNSILTTRTRGLVPMWKRAFTKFIRYQPLWLCGEPVCLGCGKAGLPVICNSCLTELEPMKSGCRRCGYPTGSISIQPELTDSCFWCRRLSVLPEAIHSAFIYRNTGARIFVNIKFGGYWRGTAILIQEALEALDWAFMKKRTGHEVICAIPESLSSCLRRPCHPADLFARGLADRFGLKHMSLIKMGLFGKHQVGLDYEHRKTNMQHRFKWALRERRSKCIPDKVFLVDDVLTTGATLEAATKVLLRNGVKKVSWITLFRAI
ncbi:MAG: hypothetical protein CSA81_06920 [Acidobacteria bacterium]|nr:MAG: hypothetical protein CSA81_06920 [Acidobacteriota bacterium]